MSRLALALALALALGGCAGSDPTELTTSPDDLPLVMAEAADQWCAATAGACCPHGIHAVAADPEGMARAAWATTTPDRYHQILGVWAPDEGRVYLASGLTGDLLAEVALHELGHACGCPDVTSDGRVMTSPMGSAYAPITAADVACAGGAT
jgi:hypothetical protein